METHEIALLAAVSLPALVIFAINVVLALSGERGTLLLPSSRPYPSVEMPLVGQDAADAEAPMAEVEPVPKAAPSAVLRRPREVLAEVEDEELTAREAA